MKNYKILASDALKCYGSKMTFSDISIVCLRSLGFRYDSFLDSYSKWYIADNVSIAMCIFPYKEFLNFYTDEYILPYEFDIKLYTKVYKSIMEDIKKLREIKILK